MFALVTTPSTVGAKKSPPKMPPFVSASNDLQLSSRKKFHSKNNPLQQISEKYWTDS